MIHIDCRGYASFFRFFLRYTNAAIIIMGSNARVADRTNVSVMPVAILPSRVFITTISVLSVKVNVVEDLFSG